MRWIQKYRPPSNVPVVSLKFRVFFNGLVISSQETSVSVNSLGFLKLHVFAFFQKNQTQKFRKMNEKKKESLNFLSMETYKVN